MSHPQLMWVAFYFRQAMDHLKIEVDDDRRIVRVFNQGTLTIGGVLQMVKQARTIAHQNMYDLLYDLRDVQFVVGVMDLYSLTRNKEIYKGSKSRIIKSANVFSEGVDKDLLDFMETTAFNNGINWRSFLAIDEALEWLCPELNLSAVDLDAITS